MTCRLVSPVNVKLTCDEWMKCLLHKLITDLLWLLDRLHYCSVPLLNTVSNQWCLDKSCEHYILSNNNNNNKTTNNKTVHGHTHKKLSSPWQKPWQQLFITQIILVQIIKKFITGTKEATISNKYLIATISLLQTDLCDSLLRNSEGDVSLWACLKLRKRCSCSGRSSSMMQQSSAAGMSVIIGSSWTGVCVNCNAVVNGVTQFLFHHLSTANHRHTHP